MARIQIITAVTLDGYLPDPNEEFLKWVKTDSQGFPFWHERSTFTLFPGYPMLDLICEKDEKPDSFTFTSEISDPKSLDLLHGLSIYHLIDEIIIYILPLTTGNGTDCLHRLPVNRWKLYRTVAFKNGIVRLIYSKSTRQSIASCKEILQFARFAIYSFLQPQIFISLIYNVISVPLGVYRCHWYAVGLII